MGAAWGVGREGHGQKNSSGAPKLIQRVAFLAGLEGPGFLFQAPEVQF